MKLIFVKAFSLVVFSDYAISQEKTKPCWVSFWVQDGYLPITDSVAMLKSNTLILDLKNVNKTVSEHIKIKDYRLLAVEGTNGPVFLGIEEQDKPKICKYGARFLNGAFGPIINKEHLTLINKFRTFSKDYNRKMLQYMAESET